MGNVRVRPETGKLQLDFRYNGRRYREQTALSDTPSNRAKAHQALKRIEAAITLGKFRYSEFFPGRPEPLQPALTERAAEQTAARSIPEPLQTDLSFAAFAERWFTENEPRWRRSHRKVLRGTLDQHLLPRFGDKRLALIEKADVLEFRAALAKREGRGKRKISAQRINHIMDPLRMILRESAERFGHSFAFAGVRNLRVAKTEVEPFSLTDVNLILASVRSDYRTYFLVRFFTGLRTGEVDGLKWKYVDFVRREILVRESYISGEQEEDTKTPESQREVAMCTLVYDALLAHREATKANSSEFVFHTRNGHQLEHRNVTQRVWYPLLRHLGLKRRRPYQTRHTAATLWLAAGENPEWIARQLGHANTQMLFKVYSRYVPNLTRADGSAFDRLTLGSVSPALEAPNSVVSRSTE